MGTNEDWFRDAVFYSLDVKTFNDGDGDGWGDLRGVRERLAYLDRLGVDCVWLLPFYPSPMRDNGYDVADYTDVDERLGTLADFRALVEAAHDRGIRVLIDVVFNHTSTEHEWFQRAREDPDSPYRDYYCWTDDLADAHTRGNIFPDREDGVWTRDEVADAHYFHQFYHFQPDLNVANPDVREELHGVLEFWLDRGVDGFRIDAATPMILGKGADNEAVEDPHGLFEAFKATVREHDPDAILLGEADDDPPKLPEYFGTGDQFDLLLNFVLNAHLVYAVAEGAVWPLHRALEVLPSDGFEHGQWANFLRNFDELNLARLPEDSFEHAREAYGEDAWIFERGLRRRLAPLYGGDHDRVACAHSLLFSLPGSPIVLAGDEIGMGEDLSLPERDAVRTPMQWSNDRNGGFSTADPADLVRPVVANEVYGPGSVNVADQLADPDSLLNRVGRIAHARSVCSELWAGDHGPVETDPDDVWVYRAAHDGTVLHAAHNLGSEPREVSVDVDVAGAAAAKLVGPAGYDLRDGRLAVSMDAREYCWIRADADGERAPLGPP